MEPEANITVRAIATIAENATATLKLTKNWASDEYEWVVGDCFYPGGKTIDEAIEVAQSWDDSPLIFLEKTYKFAIRDRIVTLFVRLCNKDAYVFSAHSALDQYESYFLKNDDNSACLFGKTLEDDSARLASLDILAAQYSFDEGSLLCVDKVEYAEDLEIDPVSA